MMELFTAGFLLSLSLCADLGVVNVAQIRLGLTQGMRPALWLGWGSCVGDLLYAASSVWLVSLLLAHRAVRLGLWAGGTLLLAWFALRMLLESLHPKAFPAMDESVPAVTGAPPAPPRAAREFGRGVLLALGSPSAILWFAAVGGSVIATHAGRTEAMLPFFGGFLLAGAAWSVLIAALAGYARARLDARWVRAFALLSALLFAYLATTVFVTGWREFIVAGALTGR